MPLDLSARFPSPLRGARQSARLMHGPRPPRRQPCARIRRGAAGRLLGFVAGGFVASAPGGPAAIAQTYVYHELATIPGFPNTVAAGVNNLGQAVGSVQDPTSFSRLAVIWDAHQPAQPPATLGIPPHSWGSPDAGASAINDHGEVIGLGKGVMPSGVGPYYGPYRWTAATGFTPLGPPALPGWNMWSFAPYAINCAGDVVGSGVLSGTYANGKVGLHWSPSSQDAIVHSPPGGIQIHSFVALQILGQNDLDQVVGSFFPSHYTPSSFPDEGHAFFWEPLGGYTTLSAAAFSGEAVEINNCEQIIGAVRFHAQGPAQTILWERTASGAFSSVALPGLSPDPAHGSYPIAINDAGQAVGRAQIGPAAFAPVVWDLVNATVVDLSPFLPPPPPGAYFTHTSLNGIGNDGTIVGRILTMLTPGGPTTTKAFVLHPASAPTVLCPGSVCLPPSGPFDLLPPQTVYQDPAVHHVDFTVVGGTPGQTVFIVEDTGGRYAQFIAGQCPIVIPPASIVVATGVVDPSGAATMTASFSNAISGSVRAYVAVDPAGCVFDVEVFAHP